MLACCRIEFRVNSAVSLATSTSRMRLSAAERFSTVEPSPQPGSVDPGPSPAAAEAAVLAWATAWSEQRVDDYLKAYSTGFVPPGGQGRSAWASQRRDRIQRPASIRVVLGTLSQTILGPDRATIDAYMAAKSRPLRVGIDEYRVMAWVLFGDGVFKAYRMGGSPGAAGDRVVGSRRGQPVQQHGQACAGRQSQAANQCGDSRR